MTTVSRPPELRDPPSWVGARPALLATCALFFAWGIHDWWEGARDWPYAFAFGGFALAIWANASTLDGLR